MNAHTVPTLCPKCDEEGSILNVIAVRDGRICLRCLCLLCGEFAINTSGALIAVYCAAKDRQETEIHHNPIGFAPMVES